MRLFFALWPTPEIADILAVTAQDCAQRFGGKATRTETIHMTLSFLGEQPVEHLPAIVDAARTVKMSSLILSIDQLGAWRHNRLLWAGCQTVPENLPCLVGALRTALRQAGLRADEDARAFFPHVTLVRSLPEKIFPLSLPPLAPLLWRCERFVLVASQPTAGGRRYRSLAEFPASA